MREKKSCENEQIRQLQQVAICAFRWLGLRKTPLGCGINAERPLWCFAPLHFCACKNAMHFSLSGAKKRQVTAGTLCEDRL